MKISKKQIELKECLGKEWIISNGIGGFASSSVLGANTRRYHGLLVASLMPPARRHLIISKLDESIIIDGEEYNFELEVNKDWELTARWEKKNNAVNNSNSTPAQNKEENIKITTPTLAVGAGGPEENGGSAVDFTIGTQGYYSENKFGIAGWELYEKEGSKYTKIQTIDGITSSSMITVDVGESKTYVARAYALNKSGKKVYSGYSNEFVLE